MNKSYKLWTFRFWQDSAARMRPKSSNKLRYSSGFGLIPETNSCSKSRFHRSSYMSLSENSFSDKLIHPSGVDLRSKSGVTTYEPIQKINFSDRLIFNRLLVHNENNSSHPRRPAQLPTSLVSRSLRPDSVCYNGGTF